MAIRLILLLLVLRLTRDEWPWYGKDASVTSGKDDDKNSSSDEIPALKYLLYAAQVLIATHLYQNGALYSFGIYPVENLSLISGGLIRTTIWVRLVSCCLYVWEKVEHSSEQT